MHERAGILLVELVTARLEVRDLAPVGEMFTGEDEADILRFAPDG